MPVVTSVMSQNRGDKWSIVVHGGAGGAPSNLTFERRADYEKHLQKAVELVKRFWKRVENHLMLLSV